MGLAFSFAATDYLSRAVNRARSDTPLRPRVHTRHATVRSAFTRARTSPAKADSVTSVRTPSRVSPAAFVAKMMTTIGISASVPSSRAATSIATTRRASLRVAASASPRPGTKPARASTRVPHAISAPTEGLGPTGVTTVGPVPSLRELRQSIPKECFEPDLAESMKYAAYDLAALAACFGVMSPVVVDHPWLLPLYAPLTGTVMWMNFVIGHDCG